MTNDELLMSLEALVNVMLESAVRGFVETLGSAAHLDRFTDDQFDRMWAVVVEDFLPYAVEERGKTWPGETRRAG